MNYKLLPELSTADAAFEAYGKSLNEVFENCAIAVTDLMIKRSSLKSVISHNIILENADPEKLLFDFLEEIVFLKDAKYVLFKTFKVKIEKNKLYHLSAVLKGDVIKPNTHSLGIDVKAITYHHFRLERAKIGWKATVVVDV